MILLGVIGSTQICFGGARIDFNQDKFKISFQRVNNCTLTPLNVKFDVLLNNSILQTCSVQIADSTQFSCKTDLKQIQQNLSFILLFTSPNQYSQTIQIYYIQHSNKLATYISISTVLLFACLFAFLIVNQFCKIKSKSGIKSKIGSAEPKEFQTPMQSANNSFFVDEGRTVIL
ncbi:Hypothetical_protein [Hexamita inflata]|uniref:Hypothetical_protein n=1 Tax=Hexamita inflata TaxID=28002 RepID=A0ABP1HFE2_9EUKA